MSKSQLNSIKELLKLTASLEYLVVSTTRPTETDHSSRRMPHGAFWRPSRSMKILHNIIRATEQSADVTLDFGLRPISPIGWLDVKES